MADDIQIEQFRIADLEALLSFLRTAYPSEPRKSDPAFWTWHFLENPNVQADNIPVWVVKSGGQIVGQLAAIPMTLKIATREIDAVWVIDLIIFPKYRGKGLAKLLFLAVKERYPTAVALGFNEMSGGVLRSLKWTAVDGLHRYHKLLFAGNAVGEIAKYKAARNMLNLIYTPFRRGINGQSKDEDARVQRATNFDASFDDLWERVLSQWPCAVARRSRFLEWQFIKQPGKKFEILGAYDQDSLVGYVVLFFRKPVYDDAPPKLAITDLVYDASCSFDVIDLLLKAAIRLAIERHTGSVVTDVLDGRIEPKLKALGFWRIKTAPQFMASTNERDSFIYDPANWFLTRADCDVSIFESPNM